MKKSNVLYLILSILLIISINLFADPTTEELFEFLVHEHEQTRNMLEVDVLLSEIESRNFVMELTDSQLSRLLDIAKSQSLERAGNILNKITESAPDAFANPELNEKALETLKRIERDFYRLDLSEGEIKDLLRSAREVSTEIAHKILEKALIDNPILLHNREIKEFVHEWIENPEFRDSNKLLELFTENSWGQVLKKETVDIAFEKMDFERIEYDRSDFAKLFEVASYHDLEGRALEIVDFATKKDAKFLDYLRSELAKMRQIVTSKHSGKIDIFYEKAVAKHFGTTDVQLKAFQDLRAGRNIKDAIAHIVSNPGETGFGTFAIATEGLASSDYLIRIDAAKALSKDGLAGERAVEYLYEYLKKWQTRTDTSTIIEAQAALNSLGHKNNRSLKAQDYLSRLTGSEHQERIRDHALRLLASEYPCTSTNQTLRNLLSDKSSEIRATALGLIRTITDIPRSEKFQLFKEFLDGSRSTSSETIFAAIYGIKDTIVDFDIEIYNLIERQLRNNTDWGVRQAAAEALASDVFLESYYIDEIINDLESALEKEKKKEHGDREVIKSLEKSLEISRAKAEAMQQRSREKSETDVYDQMDERAVDRARPMLDHSILTENREEFSREMQDKIREEIRDIIGKDSTSRQLTEAQITEIAECYLRGGEAAAISYLRSEFPEIKSPPSYIYEIRKSLSSRLSARLERMDMKTHTDTLLRSGYSSIHSTIIAGEICVPKALKLRIARVKASKAKAKRSR
ncbi:MAG: hypothetical protein ABIA04_13875 [Pseudomonadota bacterium]